MVKLKSIILVLFLLIAFAGCQKNDNTISPETTDTTPESLDKITMTEINLGDPGANTCTELVAGRNLVIGEVCIDYLESTHKIQVTYNITEPGWTITKTHIAIVRNPLFFPRKWFLRPWLNHFPYKGTHDHVTSVQYIIDVPNYTNHVYLAIHAKVEGVCNSGDPVLTPDLPNTDDLDPTWMPSSPDADQYLIQGTFTNLGIYYGWSIDNSRFLNSGASRVVQFISSYDENIPECSSFIENPQNLNLVNWIINHREPNWDRRTIQAAIWKLLNPSGTTGNWYDPNASNYMEHDVQLRETIINLAYQNGEDYEPGCGDKVLILAYGPETDPCNLTRNIAGFEFPVECNTQTCVKNAWAFPFADGQPTSDLSKRFSWVGWARYIKYQLF